MHLTYLAVLAACLLVTLPLEFVFKLRVYRRPRRLLAALCPIVVVFGAWDLLAIHQHTWWYDARYVVGIDLPGSLPLEELLFFIVIPICAVLTFEAVRARWPQWDRTGEDAS